MVRLFQIMVLSCAVVLLTGCNPSEENKPIWERVKLSDLAPPSDAEHPGGELLKTINIDIYVFEVPAGNIGDLNDIWLILYTKPLNFNDYDAFCANSFLAGFGRIRIWDKIANILYNAGGKKVETVSLLLPDGQSSDFTIARLDKEQTVFYVSSAGSMEGAKIGPGELTLRIKVERIPGSRGVCRLKAQPMFRLPIESPIPQLVAQAKSADFFFTSTAFDLKMGPGDFVLLGPAEYIDHQVSLGGLFFSRPAPIPTVRVFLLICTGIID